VGGNEQVALGALRKTGAPIPVGLERLDGRDGLSRGAVPLLDALRWIITWKWILEDPREPSRIMLLSSSIVALRAGDAVEGQVGLAPTIMASNEAMRQVGGRTGDLARVRPGCATLQGDSFGGGGREALIGRAKGAGKAESVHRKA